MIKKAIYLSLACTLWIQAAEVELETINVETQVGSEIIEDVSGEDIKSADLAEALFKQSANVTLSRRSGIANDILVRGQRKDNINVSIDGAKIYGACPNRMDPPISHVLTNNVDYIEINEGPFNVEDFGVLSADIKVHTLKPEEEVQGEVNVGFGSWDYKKASFNITGGTDTLRFLLAGSTEKGGQYEDGNGDDFAGQIGRNIVKGLVSPLAQYQDIHRDMDAFSKKTIMGKMFWDITDNQELRLSYTGNRSDDVLYPSSKMDALSDDSNIYNMEYIAKDLGEYSKELYIQVYESDVDHPMSTLYRKSATVDSNPKMPGVQAAFMTHYLTSQMNGAKIKNSFDISNHALTVGVDYSKRNWDGGYYKNNMPLPESKFHSIWDVDTKNTAFFLDDKVNMDKIVLDMGLRYDDTRITSDNPMQPSNDYDELNGYILGTYHADASTKYFVGFGKSSRVPDAKELYWKGMMGNPVGTPNLDNTKNYEADIGVEKQFENASVKAKAFYSKLDDYIAYNTSNVKTVMMMGMPKNVTWNAYENVDAKIYGFELSGTYIATTALYFDYGMAYQKGRKDDPLRGQRGKDMPEIAPFKANAAINYDYDSSLALRAEVVASDRWDDFDYENGEQELAGYGILNLKATKAFSTGFEIIVGVDNVFDNTYAVSNTYNDLILLNIPGNEVMLLNEPGRYVYTNIKYKF